MRIIAALLLLMTLSVPTAHAAAPIPSPTTTAPANTTAPTVESKTAVSEVARISTMLYSNDFRTARAQLLVVDEQFPNNADVNNLLGFTSRKLKLYSASAQYYAKALKINPKHLDALAYQGELFIATNKTAMANRNLAKLQQLCGSGCSQYKELQKALGQKTPKGRRTTR